VVVLVVVLLELDLVEVVVVVVLSVELDACGFSNFFASSLTLPDLNF
jgi:hypothetical protein